MNNPKTKPKSMSFQYQGEYYGYPPCCIAEFIKYVILTMAGAAVKRDIRQFNGTGYVPCMKCNQKSKKELLAYIETHRKCHKPFLPKVLSQSLR